MTAKKTEGFSPQRDIQESEASGVQPGGRVQFYYVQDTRQMVGNCMLWWCPDRKGYTTQIDEAGLYTYEEIRGMRPTDVGWPQEFVDAHVVRHVRRDHLRQADTVKTVKGRS